MSDKDCDDGESKSVGVRETRALLAFPVDDIRERLENDEIGISLLLVMTRAERVLSELLRYRYDVAHEPFQKMLGRESLSWYYERCNILGLTEKEYREGLNDLVRERTKIAHNDGYLRGLDLNDEKRDEVREVVEESCDWIESVHIEQPPLNPEQDDSTRLDSP